MSGWSSCSRTRRGVSTWCAPRGICCRRSRPARSAAGGCNTGGTRGPPRGFLRVRERPGRVRRDGDQGGTAGGIRDRRGIGRAGIPTRARSASPGRGPARTAPRRTAGTDQGRPGTSGRGAPRLLRQGYRPGRLARYPQRTEDAISAARREYDRLTGSVTVMSDIPPSERVRDAWESWSTDRKRAAIRAVLHRVIIKPLPPGQMPTSRATARTGPPPGTRNGYPAATRRIRLARVTITPRNSSGAGQSFMPLAWPCGVLFRLRGGGRASRKSAASTATAAGSSMRSGKPCPARERRASSAPACRIAARSWSLSGCRALSPGVLVPSARPAAGVRAARADARAGPGTGPPPGRSLTRTAPGPAHPPASPADPGRAARAGVPPPVPVRPGARPPGHARQSGDVRPVIGGLAGRQPWRGAGCSRACAGPGEPAGPLPAEGASGRSARSMTRREVSPGRGRSWA